MMHRTDMYDTDNCCTCTLLQFCHNDGQRMSSRHTFSHKYILPATWVIVETVSLAILLPDVANAVQCFALIGQYAVSIALVSYLFAPIKSVYLSDSNILRICNFITNIEIPLSSVTQVRQNKMLPHKPVTVTFVASTVFGNQIVFMPPILLGRDRKVVAVLHSRIRDAKSEQQGSPTACGWVAQRQEDSSSANSADDGCKQGKDQ